ncbi:uncharacterized protein LOC143538445 [Bidens hawaiensis]|uniref:uncharacterized protein LOC143538445 n=1 Tax=Bidens hawaiensis TaxID=980011 RepID=UPI00404ACA4A
MGGKIDRSINKGNAPFVFRLSGQNYHSIGSLLPDNGSKPKFAQLDIYDTDNEVSNRQGIFCESSSSNSASNTLDLTIISELKQMLDSQNHLVKSYRMARVVLNIIQLDTRDIVVKTQDGNLIPISELHPSYLPLQYPLLHVYEEDGYRIDIPHRVDAYTMIESERLFYICCKKSVLRSETYENLCKLKNKGNKDISRAGQCVILPSSFTGSSRYMMQNYLDAMSLCKWFGYPDFFITLTCNPNWPEIKRFLKDTNLRAEDRPDISCRIFKMKLDSLIKDLKDKQPLGKVQAVVYTVEYQKRGLPHAYICIFLHPDSKLSSVEDIDPKISAEIPNKDEDPVLYSLIKDFMIHGPCGAYNPKCSCMIDNKFSKNFPKRFNENTCVDTDGFPIYKRPDNGRYVDKSGFDLDSGYVVSYNKCLLKRYQGRINVEWCNQSGSIKYLFKYINKGPDRTTISVGKDNNHDEQEDVVDEIKEYYDCRYLSACEATWRILVFDVHYRIPSVTRLPFHLPGKQSVVYGADEDVYNVLEKELVSSSMFTSWMKCNQLYEEARKLTYVEFPTKFTWKLEQKR